ncbi:MAG: peptide chain release factor N(5)-glutamine methyltransferase [Candidatus Aureabacteria bacterium]|nr:peptide chain release factor N(5)-glutamine methyltransferase [Candidatus Auribacterota bacterium]
MELKSNRVIDVINWGRELFLTRDVPHARYNIEVLLEHILGKKRAELYLDYDYRLSPRELELVRGYIEKRLNRYPLWHLVGSVEFYGVTLRVNDRVLIPRPETELLVELALKELDRETGAGVRYVADIGTGSGNIAISLARSRSDVFIYATDISADALALAEANARANGVDGAISLLAGDLLEPFTGAGRDRLDMVVSNPPYVSAGEWAALPREVREREPKIALYGGENGLGMIGRLVAGAPRCLRRGGRLLIEVGAGQARAVKELIARSGEYGRTEIHRDYSGIERVVLAVKK